MVVAMVAFPETQKKCQEELDAVVGRSRTPMFEDKDNLPYIRATIRELLRWRATAPIGTFYFFVAIHLFIVSTGVPHSTKQVKFSAICCLKFSDNHSAQG